MIPLELLNYPDGPSDAELRVTTEIDYPYYNLVLDAGDARNTLPWDQFHLDIRASSIEDARGDGV